jgi:hypothetical protein
MFVFIYQKFLIKKLFLLYWLGYFTCSRTGAFPDTANCALGRYFYCAQATGGTYFEKDEFIDENIICILAPIAATCPNGQKFNRLTNNCDATYNCTWI